MRDPIVAVGDPIVGVREAIVAVAEGIVAVREAIAAVDEGIVGVSEAIVGVYEAIITVTEAIDEVDEASSGKWPLHCRPGVFAWVRVVNATLIHQKEEQAMQARIRFGATMLLSSVALAAGMAVAAETASAGDCFIAGFKSGDANAVAACYAEDAVMWFPGGPMAKGRAAIRDGFAGYLANVTVRDVKLTAIGEEALGDTKVSWGTYEISTVNKDTRVESVERGRYTDVQKKIAGRWLYIVDHPSDEPAPAAK